MVDETMFERRLAVALGQYADLAPTMDDELVARTAVRAGGRPRFGWLGQFAETFLSPGPAGQGMRVAYVLVLLALLLAALLAAVVGGFFRGESPIVVGHNGAIVYTIGPNNHQAVTSVAIDPDGQGIRQIEAGRCPTYSRDGKVLAWMSYEDAGAFLVVAGADGTESRRVRLVESAQQSVAFDLSPDGTRVAWFKPPSADVQGSELWVAPVDGGTSVGGNDGSRIAPASTIQGETYGSPSWSPDGHWIAFATYVRNATSGETRRPAIDVIAADGSERRRLTTRPGPQDALAWSPDSQSLAFVGLEAGSTVSRQDVYVIGVDGKGERNLTASPATMTNVAWSSDGAFLGYLTSADAGVARLTTLQVEGATGAQPVMGPDAEWFVWSPDGRELLWSQVVAVDPETNRTTLFSNDRGFQEPPRTLQVVDGLIVCTPSWQRLEG
jgi:Tol biopolymer transport system component